jgi:NAD(P)-dependent dehydrogenase (short-subunit alcohol dehydrogenase family)
MTTFDARGATRRLAEEKLKGRVALVAGGRRGVRTAIGRSLASRLGRRDGVARVVHLLYASASSYVAGRGWALNGTREM